MVEVNIHSLSETAELGETLGALLQQGMVITLSGDLGAGKTTLTKSIGKALGVRNVINSPTFTILKSYNGRFPLYHIDAYRLEGITQDLGFEELLEGDGVCIIEWPQNIATLLPDQRLDITIYNGIEENRVICFQANGIMYENIMRYIK